MDITTVSRAMPVVRRIRTILLLMVVFAAGFGETLGALELVEVDSLNATTYAADSTYIYGGSGSRLLRFRIDTHSQSNGFSFGSGKSVRNVWTTSVNGEVFALIRTGSSETFDLYRSADHGGTFSKVLALGATSSGQTKNVRILHRGFEEAFLGGTRTYLVGEYNMNSNRTAGGTNDQVRIMKSTNGTAWSTLYTFNKGTHHTRHIHAVRYDPVSERIYFALGDSPSELGIIGWDGTSPWPTSSKRPSDFKTIAGFDAATGKRRFWVTDFVVTTTDDFVYAGMEGPYSTDESEKGIWRHTEDLSGTERVYPGPNQGLHQGSGVRLGVLAETGGGFAQVWVDVGIPRASSNNVFTLYVSGEDDFGPGAWAAYDNLYPTKSTSSYVIPNGFFTDGNGKIYLSAPRRSGTSVTSAFTGIFELR